MTRRQLDHAAPGGTLPWRRLALGMGLGLAASALVILLMSPRVGQDIKQATGAATQPLWLIAAFLTVIIILLLDAASLIVLVRRLCGGVDDRWAGEVALESHLVSGATSFGGLEIPYQVFLLRRLGLTLTEATSIVVIKGLVHTSMLAAVATLALLPLGVSVLTPLQQDVLIGVLGLLAAVWIVGSLWLSRPLGARILPAGAQKQIEAFREAARTLRGGGAGLLVPLLSLQLLYWLCAFALIPMILHALGWRGDLAPIVVGQAVLQILMPFSPLPGGAGVAEFGYLELIGRSVPAGLVVPSLFLWRVATWIVPMAVGAVALGVRTTRGVRPQAVRRC